MKELKNTINGIVDKLAENFKINISSDIIQSVLKEFYDDGMKDMEIKFDMNFTRDEKRLTFLTKYVEQNIQGFNEEMIDKLRKEVTQSIINLESYSQLSKRIQKITELSIDRAKMIARTELNRAENMGQLDGARQSGTTNLVKEWLAKVDGRTSKVCKDLNGHVVPINGKFKWQGNVYDAPPAHPNCRSTLLIYEK